MKVSRHCLLVLILLVGAALRFWNLEFKPIWSDEVLTALFSLGRSFFNVPLNQALPLSALERVFTLDPEATCSQIMQTVSTQSVHPPLFFCWMHDWMNWVEPLPLPWIWKLRALPALFGVAAIAALYQLNRVAFSPIAGLTGAALMAVSPFAVYLSQEARHYTLPMLLVTLALIGLYQLQVDLYQQRFRPLVWLGWMAVNSLGFYVHYFFLLAFIAQAVTLVINCLSLKYLPTLHPRPEALSLGRSLGAIAFAVGGVCLTYLPWLPTLLSHLTRPETDWLANPRAGWLEVVAPLYQIPLGWILMVIALPAESQLVWVVVLSVGLMLLFMGWLIWQDAGRFGQLWSAPETHLAVRMLVLFVVVVLLEFLIIIYFLDKDISQVPRYNFIYFPAVCALLGASLAQIPGNGRQTAEQKAASQSENFAEKSDWRSRRRSPLEANRRVTVIVLLVGLISSGLVVSNQVFQKPYQPELVAQNMRSGSAQPMLVAMASQDWQDVALGLSFALALQKVPNQTGKRVDDYFAFLPRSQGYEKVWQSLTRLTTPLTFPLNFWLVAPGLRQADYPSNLSVPNASSKAPSSCQLAPDHYYRLGVPYQMYRCN